MWLNPGGKTKILESEMLPAFIQAGYTIVASDMPGTGELKDPNFRDNSHVKGVPFNFTIIFGAQLIGKSISRILAEEIDLLMQFVAEKNRKGVEVDAFVERETSIPFLHYTAFRNPFTHVVLLSPLTSYRSLIREKYYDPHWAYYVVPGSLPWYDFKDLISFLPKGSCKLVNPITSGNEEESGYNDVEIMKFLESSGTRK